MAVEGQFVLSTEGGNTRKWRRTGAALPPGAGAGTGHRAPGTGRWRGSHGTLWRKCQPRVQYRQGGSRPGSSPGSTVVVPAGFREARASWGDWSGEGLRWPKGIRLPSFSHSRASALFIPSAYSSHPSPGDLRRVLLVRKWQLEQRIHLCFQLLGGGERLLWWRLLLFGLFNPS